MPIDPQRLAAIMQRMQMAKQTQTAPMMPPQDAGGPPPGMAAQSGPPPMPPQGQGGPPPMGAQMPQGMPVNVQGTINMAPARPPMPQSPRIPPGAMPPRPMGQ